MKSKADKVSILQSITIMAVCKNAIGILSITAAFVYATTQEKRVERNIQLSMQVISF